MKPNAFRLAPILGVALGVVIFLTFTAFRRHQNALRLTHPQASNEQKALSWPLNAQGQRVVRLPILWLRGAVSAEQLRFDWDTAEMPGLTLYQGKQLAARPIVFSSLLQRPDLWNHAEFNDIQYELQRGYYTLNGYSSFGLITSSQQTYLGIRWYSPAASQMWIFAAYVFRLHVEGNTLEMTLVRKLTWQTAIQQRQKVPYLSQSAQGGLLLMEPDGVFSFESGDRWKRRHAAPKQ